MSYSSTGTSLPYNNGMEGQILEFTQKKKKRCHKNSLQYWGL